MGFVQSRRLRRWGMLLALWLLSFPVQGRGDILYKNYELRSDRGQDILCAPYEVRKHDWVYKIFKLRGEIAQKDFPAFIGIFRRLNPHIDDINTIRPGQRILIPLRRVERGQLPVAPSGRVTIPFVDRLGNRSVPMAHQRSYIVAPGDCVSKLLAAAYGDYGTEDYRRAEALFRRLNPWIKDLNQICVGQRLVLFDAGFLQEAGPAAGPAVGRRPVRTPSASPPVGASPPPVAASALARTARLLQATLKNRGDYFIPRSDGPDLQVSLDRTPLMTLADGTRLLFSRGAPTDDQTLAALKRHWPRLVVVPTPEAAPVAEQVKGVMAALADRSDPAPLTFRDGDVQVTVRAPWVLTLHPDGDGPPSRLCVTPIDSPDERTPSAVVRYLESHGIRLQEIVRSDTAARERSAPNPSPMLVPAPRELSSLEVRRFVADLCEAAGYDYAANVRITFPYAGIQVEAVSNVVNTPQGTPLFIDFGDLYGEAFDAIRRTGFRIIRIERHMPRSAVVRRLLDALGVDYAAPARFLAARRPAAHNVELVLPGVLLTGEGNRAVQGGRLITTVALDRRLAVFLALRQIEVLRYRAGPPPVVRPTS